jgi:fructoselysine 6-phosphate deglycase
MANPFDRNKFISDLHLALDALDQASELGFQLGRKDIRRLFLIACGAPNQAMSVVEYWAKKVLKTIEIRRYFPAEFIHQDPLALEQDSLVILSSHSGKTKEILQAAAFLQEKKCTTIAITQSDLSPLARQSKFTIAFGEGKQGYYAGYMLVHSLISAILKEKESWNFHSELMASLKAMPESLAQTTISLDSEALKFAQSILDEPLIYIVGAGPVYCTAYVIATCILMEMQWIHAHPLRAAEFFHGPFEVFDENTPLILLLGEDPSRPEAERVMRFCTKISSKMITLDSKALQMDGIDDACRPILAPFFLDAVLFRMAEHLASLRTHPLTTRRYMGKMEY